MVEQEGGDCMGNQDPPEQGHAGECQAWRCTRPDVANVVATRNNHAQGPGGSSLPCYSRIHERGKRALDLSLRAWLSPWSHPADANTYITVGFQVWISRVIQSHQIRSSSARSNFKDLINTLN